MYMHPHVYTYIHSYIHTHMYTSCSNTCAHTLHVYTHMHIQVFVDDITSLLINMNGFDICWLPHITARHIFTITQYDL